MNIFVLDLQLPTSQKKEKQKAYTRYKNQITMNKISNLFAILIAVFVLSKLFKKK